MRRWPMSLMRLLRLVVVLLLVLSATPGVVRPVGALRRPIRYDLTKGVLASITSAPVEIGQYTLKTLAVTSLDVKIERLDLKITRTPRGVRVAVLVDPGLVLKAGIAIDIDTEGMIGGAVAWLAGTQKNGKLACSVPIGFKAADAPFSLLEINFDIDGDGKVSSSEGMGLGMAGLSRDTNVRLPSAANLKADAKVGGKWDFGTPIENGDYGVCDSSLLSWIPETAFDLILEYINTHYLKQYASDWIAQVAQAVRENPCFAASLANPLGTRLSAEGTSITLNLVLDGKSENLHFQATAPAAKRWVAEMLGGAELPVGTELSLRYAQGRKGVHADLLTVPGKTDAFLNHMILALQGFGSDKNEGDNGDRSGAEQILLIDTVSSVLSGWKMMAVARNTSDPIKRKYFYPGNGATIYGEFKLMCAGLRAALADQLPEAGALQEEEGEADAGAEAEAEAETPDELLFAEVAAESSEREKQQRWSPSTVEEALVGLDISSVLPPSLKNIDISEALGGWLGKGQASLGFNSVGVIGLSLRRFDFRLVAKYSRKQKALSFDLVPNPLKHRETSPKDNDCAQKVGRAGCETYCILPPDETTGRVPFPWGKCLATGSGDDAEMAQQVAPQGCAATATDISQCPNFPLRLNVVLSINQQRTLLNSMVGVQDLVGLHAQFKYPIVVTVDIPFLPGSSLLGLHWSRVNTAAWLVRGAKRYEKEDADVMAPAEEAPPDPVSQPGTVTTRSQCDPGRFWCLTKKQQDTATGRLSCINLSSASRKLPGTSNWWHALKAFEICHHSDPRCTSALGSEAQEKQGCLVLTEGGTAAKGAKPPQIIALTSEVRDNIRWRMKNGKKGQWTSPVRSTRYNTLTITFTSQRNRKTSSLYVSLTGKTPEVLPVDYVELIRSKFGPTEVTPVASELGECVDAEDLFLAEHGGDDTGASCEPGNSPPPPRPGLPTPGEGEILWARKIFDCSTCSFKGCCMYDVFSAKRKPCAQCACLSHTKHQSKCHWTSKSKIFRCFGSDKTKSCAALQMEQDASNTHNINAATPSQMSLHTSSTPEIRAPRLPVAFMPDTTVVKEGLVHFASHYSLRDKMLDYWGVLRVVDGGDADQEESTEGRAGEEKDSKLGHQRRRREKRRTFELYKLSDRWSAAQGPMARAPHYMYTFGEAATATVQLVDDKPGVFSLVGGGERYTSGTSALDLSKFGTFSVAVEGDDDNHTYTKQAVALWVKAIRATAAGDASGVTYTRGTQDQIDPTATPEMIRIRPSFEPSAVDFRTVMTRIIPKDDAVRATKGFQSTKILDQFNTDSGGWGALLSKISVKKNSFVDWFGLCFGRAVVATATGYLAQDPCFQSTLMGKLDVMLSEFDKAMAAERGGAETSGPSGEVPEEHDIEISIGLRYKSSADEDTPHDELGVDVQPGRVLSQSWGQRCLGEPERCDFALSLKFKNSEELTFAIDPKTGAPRGKLNEFMLVDGPQAASWATRVLKPLANFFGGVVARAQAAFASDSDANVEFFNDMLVMDLHNNFWDHWDEDYMYSTDYDFVVPLPENKRVCEEARESGGGGGGGGGVDGNAKMERSRTVSDRLVGKKQFIHGDAHRRQDGGKHRGRTAVELVGEQSLRGNGQQESLIEYSD